MSDACVVSNEVSTSASRQAEACECLLGWYNSKTELAFVYARTKGGCIATGRAAIASLDESFIRLQSAELKLVVTILGASYSLEAQQFFTPDFQRQFMVEGVSLQLENFDWLFLSASATPDKLELTQALLAGQA